MKDYNIVSTDFTNKIALSMQPGRENEAAFSDACNASGRFLHLAKVISDKGFLGWQISPDGQGELSSFVFTSAGVNATAEDYNWIFKNCAVSKSDKVSYLKNLCEENRKVYILSYKSESTEYYEDSEDEDCGFFEEDYKPCPGSHFKELFEMLTDAGAMILMIADSSGEKVDCGLVFISFPNEISLRVRGMISMALPHVEIEDISISTEPVTDTKHIPDDQFRSIMSNLLYALMSRPVNEAEPTEFHRQVENIAAAAEGSRGVPSDQNDDSIASIENLELSIRSYNCLKREGICTIEELRTMTDEDYQHVRNLGRSNIAEIKEKLAGYLRENPVYEKIPSLQTTSYNDILDELIGLQEAKQQIRKIAAYAKMRRDLSTDGSKKMSVALNMEFIGNPGTAKTTVARILAGIFYEIGLLSSKKMIEVGRADLIGIYAGQTAGKVKNVFLKAKGKMLFIDEAYSLIEKWEGAYGDEAISTIVQEMENNREDTIVVFAGYPGKMREFFDRNPGLRSRVPFTIHFDDYTTDEMAEIAELEAKKRGFRIETEAMEKVRTICNMAAGNNVAGNGRLCRNLVEGAILEYALRTYDGAEKSTYNNYILTATDFLVPNYLKEPAHQNPIGFAV